jgi:hypothetical protein
VLLVHFCQQKYASRAPKENRSLTAGSRNIASYRPCVDVVADPPLGVRSKLFPKDADDFIGAERREGIRVWRSTAKGDKAHPVAECRFDRIARRVRNHAGDGYGVA